MSLKCTGAGPPQRGEIVRRSLALDRGGRLAADIIGHLRYAADLVDDPVGDLLQQLIRQVRPASGHEVDSLHGARRDHPLVAANVTDHALFPAVEGLDHCTNDDVGGQHGERWFVVSPYALLTGKLGA